MELECQVSRAVAEMSFARTDPCFHFAELPLDIDAFGPLAALLVFDRIRNIVAYAKRRIHRANQYQRIGSFRHQLGATLPGKSNHGARQNVNYGKGSALPRRPSPCAIDVSHWRTVQRVICGKGGAFLACPIPENRSAFFRPVRVFTAAFLFCALSTIIGRRGPASPFHFLPSKSRFVQGYTVNKNVLASVVDDDESVRESIPDLLRAFGFEVRAFDSAEAFLASDVIEATRWLILDVTMPGMSGPELFEQLKQRQTNVSVIFITAHGNSDLCDRLLRQGAVACLQKPFDPIALIEAMQGALPTDPRRPM